MLLPLVLDFYETFNSREVRRRLVNCYTSSCLAFSVAQQDAHSALGWGINAVPRIKVIRSVLLNALDMSARPDMD